MFRFYTFIYLVGFSLPIFSQGMEKGAIPVFLNMQEVALESESLNIDENKVQILSNNTTKATKNKTKGKSYRFWNRGQCCRPCWFYFDVDFCYYRPDDSLLRDVYSSAWMHYQFTLDVPVWCDFYLWSGVGFHYNDGEAEGTDDIDTWYRGLPITIGAKYYVPFRNMHFFAGLGMRYFLVRIINCSEFVDNKETESKVGGAFVFGARYPICNGFYFNGFIDYSFAGEITSTSNNSGSPEEAKLDVNGLLFGAGLSYKY